MHRNFLAAWGAVLSARGEDVALIDAESGRSVSFDGLERMAEVFLTQHAALRNQSDQIWCLALNDRVEWLAAFLASVKVGAVVLPSEPAAETLLLEQAQAQGASVVISDSGVTYLPVGSSVEGTFLIKLTSGTTGKPKALPFTEEEMMTDCRQIMTTMSITSTDRNYMVLPLGHSYGLGNVVMPLFMAGVSVVLASAPYPQVIVDEATRHECTVMPLVPPLVKALSMAELGEGALSSLRLVISAGSALEPVVARRFHESIGLRVHNFYGSSETGGICFDREGTAAMAAGVVGTPLDGVLLSLDPDQAIVVESASLCHALCPSGVFTLHDYGRLDAGGQLCLTGRDSDLIKVAGRRMSLSEIEHSLCEIEGVEDAYVTSRPARSGELRCVALYVGAPSVDSVRVLLARQLSSWKMPKQIRQIPEVLYTARGKKDRLAMEALVDSFKRKV